MTKLAKRKTQLTFETEATIRDGRKIRAIIVEVDRYGVTGHIRLAGTRKRLPFSWDGLYVQAALREANRARAEKAAAKKARK